MRCGFAEIGVTEPGRFEISRGVQQRGVDATRDEGRETVACGLGIDKIDVANLQSGRGEKRLHINERHVGDAADADRLALEISDLLDLRLGKDRIGRCYDIVDDNLHRPPAKRCTCEVGISAMGDVEGAAGDLLRAASSHGQQVQLDIVLLEPAEFHRDILRPLRRTMSDHAGNDLSLRLGGAGNERYEQNHRQRNESFVRACNLQDSIRHRSSTCYRLHRGCDLAYASKGGAAELYHFMGTLPAGVAL